MASRADVTNKYAKAYARARKKDQGRMLDEVVSVTGWSRDNARRRLVAAAKTPPGPGRAVAASVREPRAGKFSYDARKVLQGPRDLAPGHDPEAVGRSVPSLL
ncbi:MAG: hypothetical protein L0H31_10060 [Nocardioidaceae bacterium]|nr:hypothetical protein [Nocardioidaceae bacterium]